MKHLIYIHKYSPLSFKCINHIFGSSAYVGINVLLVNLQCVLCYLPTPPFVLRCQMSNLIGNASEHMIQLTLMLTSYTRIAYVHKLLQMVILTLLPSVKKDCPPSLYSSRKQSTSTKLDQNVTQHTPIHHSYTTCTVTSVSTLITFL